MHQFAIEQLDVAPHCGTQGHRGPDDGIENRLHVGRRARDDLENLGRGGLLLQGLADLGMGGGERAILLLQLGEQPHVLDRDHRLVGEGLKESDLLVGERLDLHPADDDRPDGAALAQQRGAQEGAHATGSGRTVGILCSDRCNVMDVQSLLVDHRSAAR